MLKASVIRTAWAVALGGLALTVSITTGQASVPSLVAETVEFEASTVQAAPPIDKGNRFETILAGFEANADEARQALKGNSEDLSIQRRSELSRLRAKLARDRDQADGLASRGSIEAKILSAKIAALGPEPAEGAGEPEYLSEKRTELTSKLGAVQQPIMHLRDAQVTAAVLVSELDAKISGIGQRRLFQSSMSPLDPRLWIDGAQNLGAGISAFQASVGTGSERLGRTGLILGALIVALFVVGLPLLAGLARRKLTGFVDKRLLSGGTIARRLMLTMVLDGVLAIVLGLSLLLAALAMLIAIIPFVGTEQVAAIGVAFILAGTIIAISHWLGRGVLMSPFPELRLLTLPEPDDQKALTIVRRIAYVLAAELVVANFEEFGLLGPSLSRLLSALLVIAGAWLLWQLANAIVAARRFSQERVAATSDEHVSEARIDFASPVARAIKLFSLAAIAAAVAGYALLARHIFAGLLLSLGAICTAVYVHRSFGLLVTSLASGHFRRYRRILHFLPLVVGLVATLLVIPVLAVIWGYSANEIGDGLLTLRNGIEFGEVKLSAGDVFTFLIVFFAGFFLTRWLQRFLKISVMPEFGMDAGAEAALLTFLGYIGITLAAVVAIATTGLDLSSLAFIAGALSVGLGFGLQSVVENFTSGILLLMERPIKVGDWIEVGEHSGIVRKIAVRSTHVETFDRHQIIIPNSQLITEVVKNRSFSAAPTRIVVPVGVAYGTDLENARAILLDIVKATAKILPDPEPAVAVDGFGDSAINMKILAFVAEATDGAPTASQLYFAIARRFAEEGIEIPFPQRDLHVRSVTEGLLPPPTG